jgi:hypothetical protein
MTLASSIRNVDLASSIRVLGLTNTQLTLGAAFLIIAGMLFLWRNHWRVWLAVFVTVLLTAAVLNTSIGLPLAHWLASVTSGILGRK